MKTKILGMLALLLIGVAACKYDDEALWNKLSSLEERIASLEGKLSQMNSDISAMNTIVNALENNVSISKVEDTGDGYKITFTDKKEITIKNGKDGNDAPTISIEKEGDIYYWTQIIDGKKSWLTDEEGNKIPVTGEHGVTPILKVSATGYWLISYDRGVTFKEILDENNNPIKAIGEDGKDGADGKDGEDGKDGINGTNGSSFFKNIEVDEENSELILILKDGTELRLAISKEDDKLEEGVSYTLNKNVIQLTTEDEEKYIQTLIPDQINDKNTIVYTSNTPKNKLPNIGNILLYSEISDRFPSGFLGKVTNVEEKNGATYIYTESVALNEAFDKLYFDQTFDLEPQNDSFSRSSIEKDEDGFFSYELPFSLGTESGIAGASIAGSAKLGLKAYVHIEIDEIANKSPWAVVTLQVKNTFTAQTNASIKGKKDLFKSPIGPEIPCKVHPTAIILTPCIQVYGLISIDGSIGLTSNWSYTQQNISGIEYKDYQWNVGSNKIKSKEDPFSATIMPEAKMTLEGTIFGGIATGLELRLFNTILC